MMKDDRNIDKAFRDKLDGFNAEPPAHLWDGIQGQMAAERRKKRMAWYSWASVAALLVLAFLAGWYLSSDTTLQPASEMAQSETTPMNETVPEKEEEVSSKQIEPTDIIADQSGGQIADASRPSVSSGGSEDNIQKTAVADFNRKQENEREEISSNELKILNSIEADVNNTFEELSLKTKEKKDKYFGLTDEERKLIASNASNNRKNEIQNRGWKMGLNVSPGYASYSSSHSESYAQDMAYSASEGSGNVGAGFSVQYQTGKRWSIESGVYYAKSGQKSQTTFELFARNNSASYGNFDSELAYAPAKALTAGQMAMNSTAGVIALDKLPAGTEIVATPESEISFSNALLSRGEFSQVFDFIEIPMYLRYKVIDSKVDIDILGGVNAGLVVGNNAYLDNGYGTQNIGKTEDVSSLNMSGTIGVGVNYALGKHFSLAVEPRFNYYLNSINRNPAVEFRPYRVGVYTGLYYDF
jgi:hypothetical protein